LSDASVFDFLNTFRRRFYVSREAIIPHIVSAVKDADDAIEWVELTKEFHSALVSRAVFTVCQGVKVGALTVQRIKRSFFVFILEVLNGGAHSFFDLKDGVTKEKRANKERKRLAKKRSRAAKRERERLAPKTPAGPATERPQRARACLGCSKAFASKKALQRHRRAQPGCKTNARKLKQREVVVTQATTAPDSPAPPPVTDVSEESAPPSPPPTSIIHRYCHAMDREGTKRVCEDCSEPALFVVMHGMHLDLGDWSSCYLKCADHDRGRGDLLPYLW